MKYRIYFTNLGWFSQEEFTDLDDAKRYVVKKHFEATIYRYDTDWSSADRVCSWTVFGGWRN
jgi:hypothetical protein